VTLELTLGLVSGQSCVEAQVNDGLMIRRYLLATREGC
jgi:hypothetical protein